MRILAIDPGFERVGIAVIDKTIKPKHIFFFEPFHCHQNSKTDFFLFIIC